MSLAEAVAEQSTVDELRSALVRAQRQLAAAKAKTDAMVEAAYSGAKDAMLAVGAPPPVAPPRRSRAKGRPEWALWHMTDWQGAKVTTSYNSKVMRERVMRFVAKAADLTDNHRSARPVDDVAVVFGGDMIEGLFNYPTQSFEIDATLHEQWANTSELVAEVVRGALSIYRRVLVVSEWGNHGRIGSRRDTVPRSDNMDRMVYNTARLILRGEERLTWQDCPEDIQRLEIGAYRALVIHGDEVGRNGFASAQTMVAHANRWRSGAYPWDFGDLYVGHFHRHAEEPLANGRGCVYWTGSTESDNRYAREQLAASGEPSQRLHFIDPERGRVTAQYKVHLR